MPQVFISYAHVSPDRQLAEKLCRFIEANGFAVFADSKIRLGEDWVEQIDAQLRSSTHFVVLLSQASVKSDMVRREIAIAYKLRKARQIAILPVRLAFEDELPYELGAYLDLIQFVAWRPEEPFDPICELILDSMRGPGETKRPSATPSNRFAAADLEPLKRKLAEYLGPVARVLVDRAARKAMSRNELHALLAAEVPAEEREKFLQGLRG